MRYQGLDAAAVDADPNSFAQRAYVKASNTNAEDVFGASTSLSADGSTLVVGAPGEASSATGTDGNQNNNSDPESGAVYVFARTGTTWGQQTYVKASNTHTSDRFGYSTALSSDGSTLAIGAPSEASSATGVDGYQNNHSATDSGAVYLFVRTGGTWIQQGYIKASNTDASDFFGTSIALSADGSTLVVGAPGEASSATGIDGDQSNNSDPDSGAVYVFARVGTTWGQQAYVKASNTDRYDGFGEAVAISGDGATLAVGADFEGSAATGVDGNQADNSDPIAGAVYIFTRTNALWMQQAYVKASNTDAGDAFGVAVTLSSDGSTLSVGADGEASAATGVNGDQTDNSKIDSGAVYVFTRTNATWAQEAYVKASNTDSGDVFGSTVSLAADGSNLAVAAIREDSWSTGVGGDETNNGAQDSGAVYIYMRAGTNWMQQAYVKASNTDAGDLFGFAVMLSSDGSTLAVGAPSEASAAIGVNGDQSDNSAPHSGAEYVFTRSSGR